MMNYASSVYFIPGLFDICSRKEKKYLRPYELRKMPRVMTEKSIIYYSIRWRPFIVFFWDD